MKKVFGVLALLVVAVGPLWAAERGVVCELFTATW
jgi:hypothetical protein